MGIESPKTDRADPERVAAQIREMQQEIQRALQPEVRSAPLQIRSRESLPALGSLSHPPVRWGWTFGLTLLVAALCAALYISLSSQNDARVQSLLGGQAPAPQVSQAK